MNEKHPENLKRRGFLLAAGMGGAGAVAAVAVTIGKEKAQPPASVSVDQKDGQYSETAHISNYYRTARV